MVLAVRFRAEGTWERFRIERGVALDRLSSVPPKNLMLVNM
jgi:hypothetical protein